MPKRKLGSHLEWHRGQIRVVVAVPRQLQATIGKTKLKAPLGTDSPARAEAIKWQTIANLKAQLAAAANVGDRLTQEALSWREEIAKAPDRGSVGGSALELVLLDRAEEIERAEGPSAAKAFVQVATGNATPLTSLLDTYLAETTMKPRSKSEARLALRRLNDWLSQEGAAAHVEAIDRRTAGRFISEALAPKYERATVNKLLSFLSGYWGWLERRGVAKENPWLRQGFKRDRSLPMTSAEHGGGERPFTDEEAAKLFHGPASPRMRAIMEVAALSGMRIDEVCRLWVGDCADGWFSVNARRATTGEGKTRAAVRRVPIHPHLKPLIERLTAGRKATDYLIADLPDPRGDRERSMPASKEFGRYRRAMGVDERPGDKRRSNVNFHSWRRWFLKKARDAGVSPWVLADLVGHDKNAIPLGLTMATYPGPSSEAALKAAIEAVPVPTRPLAGGDCAGRVAA